MFKSFIDIYISQRYDRKGSSHKNKSKKDAKDQQETIQSSTTPDQGYHMGK